MKTQDSKEHLNLIYACVEDCIGIRDVGVLHLPLRGESKFISLSAVNQCGFLWGATLVADQARQYVCMRLFEPHLHRLYVLVPQPTATEMSAPPVEMLLLEMINPVC